MVQAQENWSDLEGIVRAVRPDPERSGHVLVFLEVRAANHVEGYPNFFEEHIGESVDVAVRKEVPRDSMG